jgi:uncharacterized membrane protein YgcG
MGFGRLAWSATGWAGCGSIEAARHHRLFCAILALGMAGSMLLSQAGWVFALALAVWGIANTALYPICQIRVMKAASGAQALAGTLNVGRQWRHRARCRRRWCGAVVMGRGSGGLSRGGDRAAGSADGCHGGETLPALTARRCAQRLNEKGRHHAGLSP